MGHNLDQEEDHGEHGEEARAPQAAEGQAAQWEGQQRQRQDPDPRPRTPHDEDENRARHQPRQLHQWVQAVQP